MTDPLSVAAAGVTVAQSSIGLLDFLWGRVKEADVIAALFDPAATRITGDGRISVQIVSAREQDSVNVWYAIEDVPEFEFVPYATNPYLEIRVANVVEQPHRRIWRWVYPPHLGTAHGGRPGAPTEETNFIVLGYKPSAIVRHFLRASK